MDGATMVKEGSFDAVRNVPMDREEARRNLRFIDGMRSHAKLLGIDPKDLIHIGGIAIFYHIQKRLIDHFHSKFDDKKLNIDPVKFAAHIAKLIYRGTHDADILVRNRASFNQILHALNYENEVLSEVLGIDANHNQQFETKAKLALSLKREKASLYPQRNSSTHRMEKDTDEFEIDLYYFNNETKLIHFNDRYLGKKQGDSFLIIAEEPLVIDLEDNKGRVCVPGLIDCFLFKTDIISFSNTGLRPKDAVDLIFIISNFNEDEVDKAIEHIISSSDARKKLLELNRLLANYKEIIKHFSIGVSYSVKENTGNALVNEKKLQYFANKVKKLVKNI